MRLGGGERECGLKLSLRPREAAKALGVSPRSLWALTKEGAIPHFRIGRSVLYSVDSLREWLKERAAGKGVPEGEKERQQVSGVREVAA